MSNKKDCWLSRHAMEFAFLLVLLYLATSLFFNSFQSCDVHIDYDVSIDSNESLSNLQGSEVKLACYKLCIDELKTQQIKFNICMDKCEVLE